MYRLFPCKRGHDYLQVFSEFLVFSRFEHSGRKEVERLGLRMDLKCIYSYSHKFIPLVPSQEV